MAAMMEWSFNGVTLLVCPDWSFEGGYDVNAFRPPGVDGELSVDDSRRPMTFSVTVEPSTKAQYVAYQQLFNSGVTGDLVVPCYDDYEVYTCARIQRPVWGPAGPGHRKCRLEIVCPDPRPTWDSDWLTVF